MSPFQKADSAVSSDLEKCYSDWIMRKPFQKDNPIQPPSTSTLPNVNHRLPPISTAFLAFCQLPFFLLLFLLLLPLLLESVRVFAEVMRFASMRFCHSGLINGDQYVLCKAALIFGVTRWIFFWAHKLVKHYMCLFSLLCVEDESSVQTPTSPSSLAMARENLSLTTFGNMPEERESCHDMSCAVCLMSFRKRDKIWKLSTCSHVFHRKCLDRWLRYDARMTCPLCRTSLIATTPEPPSQQPSWAVERIRYLFGDDLLYSSPYAS